MGKVKTSNKPKKSSTNILKGRPKLTKENPLDFLLNEDKVAQAFWECLKENDPEGAKEILECHLYAKTKSQLEEEPIQEQYLIKSKNPTLKTLAKRVHAGSVY